MLDGNFTHGNIYCNRTCFNTEGPNKKKLQQYTDMHLKLNDLIWLKEIMASEFTG